MIAYRYMVYESSDDEQNESLMEFVATEVISGEPMTEREVTGKEETEKAKYAEILNDRVYMEENRIYVRKPAVNGEVKLCFAGDILFDKEYAVMATARQRGGTVEQAFSADLLERMRSADVMMVNNEFPYTDRGSAIEEKQFTFRANPATAAWLDDMGVDIVSLANNHAFDFGEVGLLDTLDTLKNVDMPYVGAGQDLAEASAPVYFIVGDMKIAFVSATQIERLDNPDTRGATEARSGVFRCWNPEKLCEVVSTAKENSDFVVVYIHWGTENVIDPDWAQLDQAPKIAEAGADLIIGDHPHCLQGITYCGQVPVIYSLGNFWFSSKTIDTGMVEVVLDEQGIKTIRFVPALQKDCTTSLLYGAEKDRVLQSVREMSTGIQIDNDGFIQK